MKLTMLIEDGNPMFREISLNCQQFLEESEGNPLVKWCPRTYADLQRVKVRKRKQCSDFDAAFNCAFASLYPSIRQRSIIVNDVRGKRTDQFYVFPSDGYKFIHSPTITNSVEQYGTTFDDIRKSLSVETGTEIFQDVLKYGYTSGSLSEAILDSSEIIVYNIPYFYVARCHIEYDKLLEYIV